MRAVIEELQPYETGGDLWEIEPLWILNELARFDRHRSLHIGYERAGNLHPNLDASRNLDRIEDLIPFDGPFEIAEVDALEAAEAFPGEEVEGAKLASYIAYPVDPDEEVHVEWESAISICFDADRLPSTLTAIGDLPMIWWLQPILPEIREVVGALTPFLPAEPPRW